MEEMAALFLPFFIIFPYLCSVKTIINPSNRKNMKKTARK